MTLSPGSHDMASCVFALEGRIEAACRHADRQRAEITLVSVSKKKPVSMIRRAHELGLRDFGENYAQELRDKASQLTDLDQIRWHFIGPLQRNKAQHVVGRAALIHSVDNLPLLERINRLAERLGIIQDVLFQVNISGEATKAGVPPDTLPHLVQAASGLSRVRCVGMMTIPPLSTSAHDAEPFFLGLQQLRDDLGANARATCTQLSMGMSADFEVAIAHGATIVRIGSLIFGERDS